MISGQGKLVIPGLINGHIHTPEAFAKGRYDNMPLELWMTLAYGILGAAELTPRMIYLRSALCAMDAIKTGVTFFSDDILEFPLQSMETIGAVFQAYEDVGLRASISGHVINRKLPDTIVYLNDLLPGDLKDEIDEMVPPTAEEFTAFCEEALSLYHNRAGRLRFMPAPSGPQRCTEPLMHAADEFARANGLPFHTHILESKVQAVTGRELYGKTLIQYMHDLGLLTRNTTIAHGIWLTDDDIALMGEARCSVVHNALSNLKLGSGICAVRRLLDAGVNLALGSDGIIHQRHAAHVQRDAVRGPDAQHLLARQRVLARRPRGACMRRPSAVPTACSWRTRSARWSPASGPTWRSSTCGRPTSRRSTTCATTSSIARTALRWRR